MQNILTVTVETGKGYEQIAYQLHYIINENNELDAMLLEKIKKLSSANRIVLDGIVDALLEGERNGYQISVKD